MGYLFNSETISFVDARTLAFSLEVATKADPGEHQL